MIHGQKRSKRVQKTPEQLKQQQERSQKINSKLKEFFQIRSKPIQKHQVPALLEFTSILMQLCSDIPTIFNFRREVLQSITQAEGASLQQNAKLFSDDYKLNTKIIQSDPKSYTLWTHRQWLIQRLAQIDPAIVTKQKQLIRKLLQKDEKNFHVWNYRSWVNTLHPDVEGELAFTSQKIKQNPFNFSPYHFRSRYLTQKFGQTNAHFQEARVDLVLYGIPKALLDEELESIQTAIFLNPKQEAPWNFYNWIVSRMVPAILLQIKDVGENKKQLLFNMKVSNPKNLVMLKGYQGTEQPSQKQLKVYCQDGGVMSQTWLIESPLQFTVQSTLEAKLPLDLSIPLIKLQNTGNFLIGSAKEPHHLSKIHQLIQQQLKFVTEVIQSEEGKCRFGWLQAIIFRKALLISGFYHHSQWSVACDDTLKIFDELGRENKNLKYVTKVKEWWDTIKEGNIEAITQIRNYNSAEKE